MDISYLLFLQELRESLGSVFDSFFLEITTYGEAMLTFLVLGFVYWCVDKRAGSLMALNVSISCTWNHVIKNICKVDRPWVRDERIKPVQAAIAGAGGYSFPSGHTQRAVAIWGSLGTTLWKEKKKGIGAVCWGIVLLIAFSRNYLGVHTPQDVLFAAGTGIVLLFVLDKVLFWADQEKNRDLIVAAVGCLLCFLPMLRVGCLANAGAGMGFLIGWALERHFVKFETDKETWAYRCVRFAIGAAGIIFIQTALKAMLSLVMAAKYAGFFSNFTLAIFIMAVYPFFFSRKNRYKAGVGMLAVLMAGILIFSGVCQKVQNDKAEQEETVGEVDATKDKADAAGEAVDNATSADLVGTTAEGSDLADVTTANADSADMAGTTTANTDAADATETEGGTDTGNADKAAGEQEATVPFIVAHRGYSGVFPENTLASFQGALDIGADYIELDVQLSKDGQVVVLHDDTLQRTAGVEGTAADYTCEELTQMDVGSWFSTSYQGEKLPTLKQVLELVKESECRIYLELKDIGDVEGFEEAVLEVTKECDMTGRCMFASFNYNYLAHLKELNEELLTLYNTSSGKVTLPQEFPADYYGINIEVVTQETIDAIHKAGRQAFVWTVNTPVQMKNVQLMGADGMVTNYPGLANVVRQPAYSYLVDNYEKSFTIPGMYGDDLSKQHKDMIVQGFTKAGSILVVSAYSKSGEYNSVLYLMNTSGKLLSIVDLGFKAHTGGISYDEAHDLLWVTGPEGMVYAIRWSEVKSGAYQGEILVSFDAGLRNHNDSKVASFLTVFEGQLFVGSYVNGAEGVLNRYDLTDINAPKLLSTVSIPQRIQGITFKREAASGICYMLLSQGYQTEDAHLLKFIYEETAVGYSEPVESHVLPEGAEQIQMTPGGMYILFESAAWPYRETARIMNDQIYLVRE